MNKKKFLSLFCNIFLFHHLPLIHFSAKIRIVDRLKFSNPFLPFSKLKKKISTFDTFNYVLQTRIKIVSISLSLSLLPPASIINSTTI